MRKEHILIAIPLLFVSVHAKAQKQQAVAVETASCAGSPLLSELSKASGTAILSLYGYHLNEPWHCTKIESPWTAGARMLHFRRMSAQLDESTAFSVMEVTGVKQIWVIPTASGMLEAPNLVSDPHNVAAFNALLRSLPKAPSGLVEWNAVGRLYMALLGQTEVIPIESLPGRPGSCSADGECTVAFSDRTLRAKEPYVKWTLTFSAASGSNPARLADAAREVVPSAEGEAEPISQQPKHERPPA
jgi:hypothetical protein